MNPIAADTHYETYLKHYFGYDSFRFGQRDIIESAMNDRDVLVLIPTGGGKSLCFQLPALLKPGLTIVVSPLIALMQDQVQQLETNGIAATYLNSTLSPQESRERSRNVLAGKIKLLYVAPERFVKSTMPPKIPQKNLALFGRGMNNAGINFRQKTLIIDKSTNP